MCSRTGSEHGNDRVRRQDRRNGQYRGRRKHRSGRDREGSGRKNTGGV